MSGRQEPLEHFKAAAIADALVMGGAQPTRGESHVDACARMTVELGTLLASMHSGAVA